MTNTATQNPSSKTKEQANGRAQRLRMLRQLTGLSRDKIHERYGIARGTIQNWESARFGGLTDKGARAMLSAMRAEGVYCDIQWLLHGIGQEPRLLEASGLTDQAANHSTIKVDASESYTIAEELLCFRQHNPNCTDLMVADDTMLPNFSPGDYVAGNKRFLNDINKTVGFVCIVQTERHGLLLRYLKHGSEPGHYHLIAANPFSQGVDMTHLYNIKIMSSAPVIWHRSPNVVNQTNLR